MSKRSVIAMVVLTIVGVLFGVVLASNYRGSPIPVKFAGDESIRLGAPSQIKNPSPDIRSLNKAFVEASKAATPAVVSINVTIKAKKHPGGGDMQEWFRFFSPDSKFPDPQPEQAAGSGVIISPEGYILTNNHVVDEADVNGLEVVMNDTKRLKAKVIGTDPTVDLAVIKVDENDLPTAAFANSDDLQVGEWVLAIGNPLGLQSTVTAGIVSAIGRQIGIIADNSGRSIENFIQTDAAINPGNSGGPLVNLNGEVVGINSAIATTNARYQGYGFAIPMNLARAVAEDLIKYGKVRRGYLGVDITSVDEAMAKANGLAKAQGAIVQRVRQRGAAELSGIHEGDIILSVDGKEINSGSELQSLIGRRHPGDEVTIKIYREGKTFDKKITLRSAEDETVASNKGDKEQPEKVTESPNSSKSLTFNDLGLTVRPLTAEEKSKLSIERGVLVSNVKVPGEAYNRRIGENDVILEADHKEIHSPKDLQEIIAKHKPGDAILLRIKRGEQVSFVAVDIPK